MSSVLGLGTSTSTSAASSSPAASCRQGTCTPATHQGRAQAEPHIVFGHTRRGHTCQVANARAVIQAPLYGPAWSLSCTENWMMCCSSACCMPGPSMTMEWRRPSDESTRPPQLSAMCFGGRPKTPNHSWKGRHVHVRVRSRCAQQQHPPCPAAPPALLVAGWRGSRATRPTAWLPPHPHRPPCPTKPAAAAGCAPLRS